MVVTARAELGLDAEKFKTDMNSAKIGGVCQGCLRTKCCHWYAGMPFLVVNGLPYNAPLDFPNLDTMTALMLLEKRQFSDCPPMTIDPKKQYLAILHTEKGDITLELFADKAPLAVNSFIFLARNHWFDGVTFHRVIPGFVAQAGDPTGTGIGGPGMLLTMKSLRSEIRWAGGVGDGKCRARLEWQPVLYHLFGSPQVEWRIHDIWQAGLGDGCVAETDPARSLDFDGFAAGRQILSVEIVEK